MAGYTADYLRRLLSAIDNFGRVFELWMATQDEVDHLNARGLTPTVSAKERQDPADVLQRELDVAEAAGAAARAVAVTGASYTVAGVGVIDPVANWSLMSAPKALFTPRDVRTTVATVRGRLGIMIDEAEARIHAAPLAFAPSLLHPVIWTAAADHWTTHQYRVAVREAAEALNQHWKAKLGRHDIDDTVFWQQTLSPGSPETGKPKLTWPGDPEHKSSKSMRGGLQALATGLNLTIRNITTHVRDELSEQEAMERLAAYSYFARQLDVCEILRAAEAA